MITSFNLNQDIHRPDAQLRAAGKMDLDGEDDTPPLLLAAYAGDVHALRRVIADGADV